ncbi:MAG: DUF819 family protein [Candidatus Sumerlaeaceae bacterium]|nr:DUF819 family protein [Candidatus Sumerlaeaceae bacterium]
MTPMLTDPVAIFMFLLALVGAVFFISEWRPLRGFFHYFPPLIFCYFLPMISTTAGITPETSPLYDWVNKHFLPPVLLLLLLSADMGAIFRLGPRAVGIMLTATSGIIAGAVLGFALFGGRLDAEGWKNIGALAASWTGGSANMFAVKAALEIPDKAFSPMIIVDSVFAYSWMGILIALAGWQEGFARLFRADVRALEDVNRRVAAYAAAQTRPITTRDVLVISAIGFVGGYLCLKAGSIAYSRLVEPMVKTWPEAKTFSAFTLAVILVTALGIALSFTPLRRLEAAGASKIGYALLFMLLPTFGAQANLAEAVRLPWYGAIAAMMIVTHAIFLFVALVLWRAPLFFGAVGSQSNVGGPASASVVAATYQPALAPVGVLLGVLGGVIGTYVGLLVAQLCRLMAG